VLAGQQVVAGLLPRQTPGGRKRTSRRMTVTVTACQSCAAARKGFKWRVLAFQTITNFQHDLEIADFAFDDMSACLGDLEPIELFATLSQFGDGIVDGFVSAILRRADDIDDFINVIGHG
jgi:hypothetical protein